MKRITAVFLSIFLILALIPSASAEEALSEVRNGQILNIDADNGLSYCADFYLVSVSRLLRSGDDLIINFDLGRIDLQGFFSHDRESRFIRFADGNCVSGSDFDENGEYIGSAYVGAAYSKKNQDERVEYSMNPDGAFDFEIRRDGTGTNVLKDGIIVYGADKQRCTGKYIELFGGTDYRPQLWVSNSLYLKEQEDGSLKAVKQKTVTSDGFTITSNAPEIVLALSSNEILPVSDGRAVLNYVNSIGVKIGGLSFKVEKSGDVFAVSSICPCCGEDTEGQIHLLSCGHYSCSEGFDESQHKLAECGIAGHCVLSGEQHSLCKNCQKYMCDGKEHGTGKCQHVHQWFVTSYTPPSETGPGMSVSICLTCSETLTQVIGG